MEKVNLLDCTLRDGGYINNWEFGESTIKGVINKLGQTGIEMIEVGFIKGTVYDSNKSLFPDTDSFINVLNYKEPGVKYVGMVDMSAPVDFDCIRPYRSDSIDGIRVIFKKNKLYEGFEFCKMAIQKGYMVFANFVSIDAYSDKEFIDAIEMFNGIRPSGITLVDTFGMLKRRDFRRLLSIADNNMAEGIMLCYHGHNNLQQALSNAETMVEMNFKRDIVIDACVFGMGRGAGNLNLELFAEYLNDVCDKNYKIEPMLEVMDEYLSVFYNTKFWGYSLPLYLTASLGYHPNYGIYLAEKNTLPVKAFNELLLSIPEENKYVFSKEIAEQYYRAYFKNYVDDSHDLNRLAAEIAHKKVVVVAPGKTVRSNKEKILNATMADDTITITINFYDREIAPDYIFLSNMKRLQSLQEINNTKLVVTSNIAKDVKSEYVINFSSYTGGEKEIFDNAGLMSIRFLKKLGVKTVYLAGMDGYTDKYGDNFYDSKFEPTHLSVADNRNEMIRGSLEELSRDIKIIFITPSLYEMKYN